MKNKWVFIIALLCPLLCTAQKAQAVPDFIISTITFSIDGSNITDESLVVRGSTISINATIKNNGTVSGSTAAYCGADTGDNADSYAPADTNYWCAQSFVVKNLTIVSTVTLFCADMGTTGDSVTVEIRQDDGSGKPGGSAIASTTGSGSSTAHWQEFYFSSIILRSGITYWIVMHNNQGDLDGWKWGYDSDLHSYSDGNFSQSVDGGSNWNANTNKDFLFQVQGQPVTIRIYENDPASGGTLLTGTTFYLSNPVIANGGTQIVSLIWTATPGGNHTFYALANYGASETTTANNQNSRVFPVSLAPPCGISNLTALTNVGTDGSINLQWTAPGEDENRGKATSYELRWSQNGPITSTGANGFSNATPYSGNPWTPTKFAPNEETLTVNGLTRGATYWFALKATDGDTPAHTSVWFSSTEVSGINTLCSAEAYDAVPGQPQTLTCLVGDRQISLGWTPPAAMPDDFFLYRLYYSSNNWTNTAIATETTVATSWTHTGLSHFTTYWYKIGVVDQGPKYLESTLTLCVPVSTGIIPPYAPSNLNYDPAVLSTGAIKWTWTDNSGDELGFKISDAGGLINTTAANAVSWTQGGLASNTTYYRFIQAYNICGSSPLAATDISFATSTLARPPDNQVVTSVSSHTVSLSWGLNNNPQAVFGIIRSADNFTTSTTTVKQYSDNFTGTTYTDTGLEHFTTYWYKVQAFNNNGVPTTYAVFTATRTNPGPPYSPSPFIGVARSTGSIQWNWYDTSPSTCAEAGFRIVSDPDLAIKADRAQDTTFWIEGDLGLNSRQNRFAQAYNVTAYTNSNSSAVYTFANPPTTSVPVSVSSYSATIQWSVNSNPAYTNFEVLRSTDNFATSTVPLSGFYTQAQIPLVDTGLAPCTTYWYKIRAYNGDGIPTTFDTVFSTRTNPGLPTTPTNFYGVALSTGSIYWGWTDNSSGVNYEDGFRVISDTGGVMASLSANVTWWVSGNLGLNTSYYYYVQAYNVTGYTNSNSSMVYTWAKAPITPYASQVTSSSIKVDWNRNSNPLYTNFGIYRLDATDGYAATTTLAGFTDVYRSTWVVNSNLLPATTYWYKISAFNGDGIETAYSVTVVTVTLPGPPLAPQNFYGTAVSTGSILWNWTDVNDYSTEEDGFRVLTDTAGVRKTLTRNTTYWRETGLGLTPNTSWYRYAESYNVLGSSASNPDIKYTLANPPTGTYVISVTSNTVNLRWFKNLDPVYTSWGVVRSIDQFQSTTTVMDFSSLYSSTTFTDTDLDPETTYWYKVCGYNGDGIPTLFDVMVQTTTSPAPPKPPKNFTGTALSTASIFWNFTDDSLNETGFHIKTSTHTAGIQATFPGIPLSGSTTGWTETMTGLTVNTSYWKIADSYNRLGYTNSNSTIAYTLALPPTGSYVVSVTSYSVNMAWLRGINPTHTFWGIVCSPDNFITSTMTAISYTDRISAIAAPASGLLPSTTYWLKVQAFNGDGVPTTFDIVVQTTTLPAPPAPPSSFLGTAVSTSSILWTWTDNATTEDGFVIRGVASEEIVNLVPNTTFYLEENLNLNGQYYRYVEAYNVTARSASQPDVKFTLANPPTGSYIITVSPLTIKLGWFANENPASDTYYGIIRSTTSVFLSTTSIKNYTDQFSTTTFTDTNLTPATTYYYKIFAYNGDGIPTLYDFTISTMTHPGKPEAPRNFHGIAISSTVICWTWEDVSTYEDGFYLFNQYGSTLNYNNPLRANTTFVYETGLRMNTSYYRYLAAFNVTGSSASNSDIRFTLANPPAPTLTNVSSPTFHTTMLTWNTSSSTRLKVAYSSTSVDAPDLKYLTWDNNVSSPPYKIKGLQLNTTYYFALWGYNWDMVPSISSTVISGYTIDLPDTITKMYPATGGVQITSYTFAGSNLVMEVNVPALTVPQPIYVLISTGALLSPVVEDTSVIQTAMTAIGLEKGRHVLENYVTELNMFDFSGSTSSFSGNVTITIPYADATNDGIVDDPSSHYKVDTLMLMTINRLTRTWEEVSGWTIDKTNKKLTASVPHFSIFAIGSNGPAGGNYARLYPNPFKPNSNLGHTVINFANLKTGSTIRVFNPAGELIWKLDSAASDAYQWDTKNASGKNIVSGIYIYVITDPDGGKQIGNFAIIR